MTKTSGHDPSGRITGIDICRSLAIFLAIVTHVFAEFHINWPDQSFLWLKFAFSAATPIFICLFGAMLELVYVPRYQGGGARAANGRLLNRAAQCYILYVVSIIALVVAGKYSLGFAARTMLLAGATPYTDILKFYAVALFLAPLIIWARLRFGLFVMLAAGILVHVAYPLLKSIPSPDAVFGRDYLGPIVGFLYGGGHSGVGAPSLLHGLTLVVAGMFIGSAASKVLWGQDSERSQGLLRLGGLFTISALTASAFWTDTNYVLKATDYAIFRNDNHPFYYAMGLVQTIVWMSACLYLFDVKNYRWADGVRFIGRTSLFTFAFGNMVLYLQFFGPTSFHEQVFAAAACTAVIFLQSWIFFRLSARKERQGSPLWATASQITQTFNSAVSARLERLVAPMADRYSRWLDWPAPLSRHRVV